MTGIARNVVRRAWDIVSNDAPTRYLIDEFRRLNSIDAHAGGKFLTVTPMSETKVSVQGGDSGKGLELFEVRFRVQCGIEMHSTPTDLHPAEFMPDVIGVGGAVWDALQGSFLPSGGVDYCTVPCRLVTADYSADFEPTGEGGMLWMGVAIYTCSVRVNNPT